MRSEDMTITKQANGLLYVHSQEKNNGRLPHQEPAVFVFISDFVLSPLFHHDLHTLFAYLDYSHRAWLYAGGDGGYVVLADG